MFKSSNLKFLSICLIFASIGIFNKAYAMDKLEKESFGKEILGATINAFAGKEVGLSATPMLDNVQGIENADKLFLGIHKDKQLEVDYVALKEAIMSLRGLTNKQTIQLIGDSNQFCISGTQYALHCILPEFEKAGMIEYGFTGYLSPNGELDVNSLITYWLQKNPEHKDKIIANVVGHTITALTVWGATGSPLVNTFVTVYNDSGTADGFTKFGDDVLASDKFLDPKTGDKVICLEGGAQSFKQVVNSLNIGLPIDLYIGLRKPENEVFFSAARFLKMVADLFDGDVAPTKEKVEELFVEYNSKLKSPWDPSRPDSATKAALFEQSIKEFIAEGSYQRVKSQCNFFVNPDYSI